MLYNTSILYYIDAQRMYETSRERGHKIQSTRARAVIGSFVRGCPMAGVRGHSVGYARNMRARRPSGKFSDLSRRPSLSGSTAAVCVRTRGVVEHTYYCFYNIIKYFHSFVYGTRFHPEKFVACASKRFRFSADFSRRTFAAQHSPSPFSSLQRTDKRNRII